MITRKVRNISNNMPLIVWIKSDDHDAAKACEIVLQRNELYGYVTCLQVG